MQVLGGSMVMTILEVSINYRGCTCSKYENHVYKLTPELFVVMVVVCLGHQG